MIAFGRGQKILINNVKQRAFLFVYTLAFLILPGVCLAEDVTVELVWKFPEPGWLEIEVRQGTYQLAWDGTTANLKAGESFKLGQSSLTPFLFRNKTLVILEEPSVRITTSDGGIFRVREPGKEWVSYRGNLTVTKQSIQWKLANTLDREDYLKGVVPIEMSNSWAARGFEALKAQAVAARTYMLKNMDSQGRITDSPDIHQAYWGRTVEGEASKAVNETKGEVVADNVTGELISVFYSSHNGGYTEETENVWKNHDPHYTSEPDPFSKGIGGFVDSWRFFIAADTLGEAFGLAAIREVELHKYISGRVYQVDLLDWMGQKKSVTGGAFVQKFYPYNRPLSRESFLGKLFVADYIFPGFDQSQRPLKGIWTVASQEQGSSLPLGPRLSLLKSSNDGVTTEPRNVGVFVFNGRGWGHGVGMSQWGAYHMAQIGYGYESILAHYYKNAVLVKR